MATETAREAHELKAQLDSTLPLLSSNVTQARLQGFAIYRDAKKLLPHVEGDDLETITEVMATISVDILGLPPRS